MDRLTYDQLNNVVGLTVCYLTGITAFLLYKHYQSLELEHTLLIAGCIASIITAIRFARLVRNATYLNGAFRISGLDRLLLSTVFMIVLGGIAMYMLIVKGFYGLYQLTEVFSWSELGYRLLVIVVGIKLFQSVDKLQGGYKILAGAQQ